MDFREYGNLGGRLLLLCPGTACTWQLNFKNVAEDLARRYRVIAVNYDGFEGDPNVVFTDMRTVTEKIENYILRNHGGRVDGAYGSSLGGSFVGLLIQRKRVHIDHAFIGSSDLDPAADHARVSHALRRVQKRKEAGEAQGKAATEGRDRRRGKVVGLCQ